MTETVLTISELTQDIKLVLEEGFYDVNVEGEISNFKAHSSGHRYFSLKDENAQISCVMWRSRILDFMPKDGDKINAKGRITVYPQRGNYQFDVSSMNQQGIGDLFVKFEKLKQKLKNQGYFDIEHKIKLPTLPMNIGVATSPSGAAVKDIISTLERRFPVANIHFRPTLVQGNGAADDIVKAIDDLENSESELIIIGRGGGSLEDLWCFNEEQVADRIYSCKKPIISAVGHETDFTISDFVADYRAATPTAAAEIASPTTSEYLIDGLDSYVGTITIQLKRIIENYREKLDYIIGEKTKGVIGNGINNYYQYLDDLQSDMKKGLNYSLSSRKQLVESYVNNIRNLNPKLPLEKGFALLRADGQVINKNESLDKFKNIEIVREREKALATIKKILPKELF